MTEAVQEKIEAKDYEDFQDFLRESCGIVLNESKRYLITSRLQRLMSECGAITVGDLLDRLRGERGARLRGQVIDAMTTNETFWFRDEYPFDILKNVVLPELARMHMRQLRIWSAACSSGQEPYSISMAVQEYLLEHPVAFPHDVQIVATDISPTMLDHGRRGLYDQAAIIRGLSPERRARFFLEHRAQSEVHPRIRQRVEFRELNLLKSYGLLGRFHVVFCRNVLIYFSPEARRDILERMCKILHPGGFLFLGAAETLGIFSERFRMIHCHPGVVYRLKP